MATDAIKVTGVVPASCETIYKSWLTAEGHSAMTGARATAEPGEGGKFTAWEGYISGHTITREPAARIVQAWRSADFPAGSEDSLVEILLTPVTNGTQVTFVHTNIPLGQGKNYEAGWVKFYLDPMRAYFGAEGSIG